MIRNLFKKELPTGFVGFSSSVVLLQSKQVVEGSSVTRKSLFETVDIAGQLSVFTSDDFDIASLQSIGALGKLQLTYMSHMHNMNVADSFQNLNFTSNE